MDTLEEKSCSKCFGGTVRQYEHFSKVLNSKMLFTVFEPEEIETEKVPVVLWLSGLTCNDQNFITKAGAQRSAAKHGLMLVCPDTRPRDVSVPGEGEVWEFCTGAGFYVDATQDAWKQYQMYSYVTEELQAIINSNFNVLSNKWSVMGHSMGGHGALMIALKNPGMFQSVSAFAPIANPSKCPWGHKAFTGYLGTNEQDWLAYDSTHLVANYSGPSLDILIDQGKDDQFLKAGQLLPNNFLAAVGNSPVNVALRSHAGYDHSYYFISTFIDDHVAHHAKYLKDSHSEVKSE